MDSTSLLNLAGFFVTMSETNPDITLKVWKEAGSFKFHLTNNHHQPRRESSPQSIFSTPPPVFSPKSPSQNHKPHSAPLHPQTPEPDQEIFSKKQKDDDRDEKLSQKDSGTSNQLHTTEDDQCVEVGDETPVVNNHDSKRDSYISEDRGFSTPGHLKNLCFSNCKAKTCEICEHHLKGPSPLFICYKHHWKQPHWHEKTDECVRDGRFIQRK